MRPIILVEFHEYPATLLADKFLLQGLTDRFPTAEVVSYSRGLSSGFSGKRNKDLFESYRLLGIRGIIFPRLSSFQQNWVDREFAKAQKLDTKWKVLSYAVEGIRIGDLIYDSYLRFKNAPTLDFQDRGFGDTVRHCLMVFKYWFDFLRVRQVIAVISTHTVYHLGILPRVAMEQSVPVYVFTPTSGNKLCIDSPVPNANSKLFKNDFGLFSVRTQKYLQESAVVNIQDRLSGKVGIDRLAMNISPFGKGTGSRVLSKSSRPKVVVFTHCFFDAPHYHGDLLFEDFWEWLIFLGRKSLSTDYDWYIKLHPEPLVGTQNIIRSFVEQFNKFSVLPFETSHHQLVAEGLNCGLTVYGTVGWELPWLGIPTINASITGPHAPFSFSYNPTSADELEVLIDQIGDGLEPLDTRDIPIYYAMNYDVEKKDWIYKDGKVPDVAFDSLNPYLVNTEDIQADVNRFLDGSKYRIERMFD